MNTMRDLHEAFHELELRADTLEGGPEAFLAPSRPARRLLAPVASVAAVAAVALTVAGVTVWHDGSGPGPGSGSGTTAAGNGSTTQPQMPTSQPVAQTTTPAPAQFQPPTTAEELAAKARAILAGAATITVSVTGNNVQMTLPAGLKGAHIRTLPSAGEPNGAAIAGTLTADGRSGGFDLDVFEQKSNGTGTSCDNPDSCTKRTYADGTTLWTSRTQLAAGGITEQVELDRADGAVIAMHLSTEDQPKGEGTVTASQLPLTVQQMTDFVSSDQW